MCIAVANRIINRTNALNVLREEKGLSRVYLSGKRLQKILYLCQLVWLADNPDSPPLIKDDFEAWPNGPVIPLIYDVFSVYQDGNMNPADETGHTPLTLAQESLINKIVDYTIDTPTEAFIDFTHSAEGPWEKIYSKNSNYYKVIPLKLICEYINKKENRDSLINFIATGSV